MTKVKTKIDRQVAEYQWRRRGWDVDVRWLHLLTVIMSIFLLRFAIVTLWEFAAHGHLSLNQNSIYWLAGGLASPYLIARYGKEFFIRSFESRTLSLRGQQVRVQSWPQHVTREFNGSEWTQLYVSPTQELRAITRTQEHQIIAEGPLPELRFLEKELESRLRITNTPTAGEAFDSTALLQAWPGFHNVRRHESPDRYSLEVPLRIIQLQNEPFNLFFPLAWLFILSIPGFAAGTPAALFLVLVLNPFAWLGWWMLYSHWTILGNRYLISMDREFLRIEEGPRPVYHPSSNYRLKDIQSVNYVTRALKNKNNQISGYHYIVELKMTDQSIHTLCYAKQKPELIEAIVRELKAKMSALTNPPTPPADSSTESSSTAPVLEATTEQVNADEFFSHKPKSE